MVGSCPFNRETEPRKCNRHLILEDPLPFCVQFLVSDLPFVFMGPVTAASGFLPELGPGTAEQTSYSMTHLKDPQCLLTAGSLI
jgi:hypothetical protein